MGARDIACTPGINSPEGIENIGALVGSLEGNVLFSSFASLVEGVIGDSDAWKCKLFSCANPSADDLRDSAKHIGARVLAEEYGSMDIASYLEAAHQNGYYKTFPKLVVKGLRDLGKGPARMICKIR